MASQAGLDETTAKQRFRAFGYKRVPFVEKRPFEKSEFTTSEVEFGFFKDAFAAPHPRHAPDADPHFHLNFQNNFAEPSCYVLDRFTGAPFYAPHEAADFESERESLLLRNTEAASIGSKTALPAENKYQNELRYIAQVLPELASSDGLLRSLMQENDNQLDLELLGGVYHGNTAYSDITPKGCFFLDRNRITLHVAGPLLNQLHICISKVGKLARFRFLSPLYFPPLDFGHRIRSINYERSYLCAGNFIDSHEILVRTDYSVSVINPFHLVQQLQHQLCASPLKAALRVDMHPELIKSHARFKHRTTDCFFLRSPSTQFVTLTMNGGFYLYQTVSQSLLCLAAERDISGYDSSLSAYRHPPAPAKPCDPGTTATQKIVGSQHKGFESPEQVARMSINGSGAKDFFYSAYPPTVFSESLPRPTPEMKSIETKHAMTARPRFDYKRHREKGFRHSLELFEKHSPLSFKKSKYYSLWEGNHIIHSIMLEFIKNLSLKQQKGLISSSTLNSNEPPSGPSQDPFHDPSLESSIDHHLDLCREPVEELTVKTEPGGLLPVLPPHDANGSDSMHPSLPATSTQDLTNKAATRGPSGRSRKKLLTLARYEQDKKAGPPRLAALHPLDDHRLLYYRVLMGENPFASVDGIELPTKDIVPAPQASHQQLACPSSIDSPNSYPVTWSKGAYHPIDPDAIIRLTSYSLEKILLGSDEAPATLPNIPFKVTKSKLLQKFEAFVNIKTLWNLHMLFVTTTQRVLVLDPDLFDHPKRGILLQWPHHLGHAPQNIISATLIDSAVFGRSQHLYPPKMSEPPPASHAENLVPCNRLPYTQFHPRVPYPDALMHARNKHIYNNNAAGDNTGDNTGNTTGDNVGDEEKERRPANNWSPPLNGTDDAADADDAAADDDDARVRQVYDIMERRRKKSQPLSNRKKKYEGNTWDFLDFSDPSCGFDLSPPSHENNRDSRTGPAHVGNGSSGDQPEDLYPLVKHKMMVALTIHSHFNGAGALYLLSTSDSLHKSIPTVLSLVHSQELNLVRLGVHHHARLGRPFDVFEEKVDLVHMNVHPKHLPLELVGVSVGVGEYFRSHDRHCSVRNLEILATYADGSTFLSRYMIRFSVNPARVPSLVGHRLDGAAPNVSKFKGVAKTVYDPYAQQVARFLPSDDVDWFTATTKRSFRASTLTMKRFNRSTKNVRKGSLLFPNPFYFLKGKTFPPPSNDLDQPPSGVFDSDQSSCD